MASAALPSRSGSERALAGPPQSRCRKPSVQRAPPTTLGLRHLHLAAVPHAPLGMEVMEEVSEGETLHFQAGLKDPGWEDGGMSHRSTKGSGERASPPATAPPGPGCFPWGRGKNSYQIPRCQSNWDERHDSYLCENASLKIEIKARKATYPLS